ncbi:hypothetical protein F8M41_025478 [Gigaspora margarita]|uniref:Uncharacterized protein n=1 Tax=Gigaspora margarita TaxID=4874 RepID=A0A8H4ABL7_GIGMA|nr:hypothetical protein F8M41_025478 [Gigaspora margarita]
MYCTVLQQLPSFYLDTGPDIHINNDNVFASKYLSISSHDPKSIPGTGVAITLLEMPGTGIAINDEENSDMLITLSKMPGTGIAIDEEEGSGMLITLSKFCSTGLIKFCDKGNVYEGGNPNCSLLIA